MSVQKLLMIIGDFIEDYEIMVLFQVLIVMGYLVDVVCLGKVVGEIVVICIYDFEGDQIYMEKWGYNFILNVIFVDVDLFNYDGLVILGGCVLEYLWLDVSVIIVVKYFFEESKLVVVICYGV